MYQYTIELYKNKSDNNVIDKVLEDKYIVNGLARVEVDLLKPVIDISGVSVNEYNYCYIKELQRYYYIEQVALNPNGIARLSLRVDVLKTYEADIRASRGLITRQREYNPYYGDYDTESRYILRKYDFIDAFDKEGCFILAALNGG